jgi:hypothetical protein
MLSVYIILRSAANTHRSALGNRLNFKHKPHGTLSKKTNLAALLLTPHVAAENLYFLLIKNKRK